MYFNKFIVQYKSVKRSMTDVCFEYTNFMQE